MKCIKTLVDEDFGLKSINDLPNIEITKDDSVKDLYNSKYSEDS